MVNHCFRRVHCICHNLNINVEFSFEILYLLRLSKCQAADDDNQDSRELWKITVYEWKVSNYLWSIVNWIWQKMEFSLSPGFDRFNKIQVPDMIIPLGGGWRLRSQSKIVNAVYNFFKKKSRIWLIYIFKQIIFAIYNIRVTLGILSNIYRGADASFCERSRHAPPLGVNLKQRQIQIYNSS